MAADTSFVTSSKNSLVYRAPECVTDNQYTVQSDIYQVEIVMYQLLGGRLSYNFDDYLSERDRKKADSITDAFDRSKFEDSLIEKMITRGRLLDYSSIPCHRCRKLIKIVKKAVHKDTDKRYKNTAEFLLDLHKVNILNDWMQVSEDTYTCMIKDRYYRVTSVKGQYILQTSKDDKTWRRVSKTNPNSCIKTLFDEIEKVIGA